MSATASTHLDLLAEEIANGFGLSLSAAAKIFQPHRAGRPVAPSTLFRWVRDGVTVPGGGRIKLEARRVAGRFYTSRAAIARFIVAQQEGALEPSPQPNRNSRSRSAGGAAKALDKLGI